MQQWMTWLHNVLSVCNGIVQRCHHTRHGVYQAEDNNRVALLVWENIILYLDSLEEPISGLEWTITVYDTINTTYIKYHSNINYVTSIDVSDLFLTNTVVMGCSGPFDQPPNSDPGGHRRAQLTFQSPAQVQHVTTTTAPTDQSAPSALEQFQSTILNQMMEMQKEIKSLRVSVETRDDIIQELRKEISSTKVTSATPVPSLPVAYPSAKIDSYSKQIDQDYMLRAFSTRDTPAMYPVETQAAIPMDTSFSTAAVLLPSRVHHGRRVQTTLIDTATMNNKRHHFPSKMAKYFTEAGDYPPALASFEEEYFNDAIIHHCCSGDTVTTLPPLTEELLTHLRNFQATSLVQGHNPVYVAPSMMLELIVISPRESTDTLLNE